MWSGPARVALVFFLAVCALLVLSSTGGAAGFALTVGDSIDVPDRTVSLEGDTYEIDRMAAVEQGEEISVSVQAPDGERSYVYLYDADRDRLAVTNDRGSFSDTFETDYEPGTYLVAHYYDGNFETLVPVVINGYAVEPDHATTTTAGDQLAVSATVTATASTGQPESVEVAVWNEEQQVRETLTHQGGDEYAGSVPVEELSPGEYNVHIAVRGEDELQNDRTELLALEASHALTIEASNDDPGGDPAPDEETEQTPTAEPTETPTDTPVENSSTETPSEPPQSTETPTEAGSVLTPNQQTETATEPTRSEGPLSPALAVVAVGLSALLMGYRRR